MERTLNEELLIKTLHWVEEQDALPPVEREWDQSTWGNDKSCGTTYCFAGKVATEAGWLPTVRLTLRAKYPLSTFPVEKVLMNDYSIMSRNPREFMGGEKHDEHRTAQNIAAELLGITDEQASELFYFENTAENVRYAAEAIAGHPLPYKEDLDMDEEDIDAEAQEVLECLLLR